MQPEDEIQVLTSEAVPFTLEPAVIGSRLSAVLLDLSLQTGIYLATLVAWWALDTFTAIRTVIPPQWVEAGLILHVFLVYWAYYPFFETIWHGQTPGKARMKLRVVKENGQPIGAVEAVLRGILRVLDLALLAIGFFLAAFHRRGKRLGDFVAGTIVAKERGVQLPASPVARGHPSGVTDDLEEAVRAARHRISADELNLVRQFLERRNSLADPYRSELADRLAAALSAKVGLPVPVRDSDEAERFLEAIDQADRAG